MDQPAGKQGKSVKAENRKFEQGERHAKRRSDGELIAEPPPSSATGIARRVGRRPVVSLEQPAGVRISVSYGLTAPLTDSAFLFWWRFARQ